MLHSSSRRRSGAVALAISVVLGALAMVLVATPASAHDHVAIPPFITVTGDHGPWTEFEGPYGRVYGDGTDGYIAIVGGSIEDVCFDNPPLPVAGEFRQSSDGTWINNTQGGQTTMLWVYETDLEVFAFFGEVCGGFFGAGIPFPEAFASGEARIEERSSNLAEPFAPAQVGTFVNWADGVLDGADGHRYKVKALADFSADAPGELDFKKNFVRVQRIGG